MAERPRRRSSAPVSDIERFLQEVERLRKKSAAQQKEREVVDDVEIVDDVEVVRPAPRPVARPTPPPRPRPKPVETYEPSPILDVIPAKPIVAEGSLVAPLPTAERIAPPTSTSTRRQTREGKPVSLIAEQVVAMLRNRQQLRSAILLGEILGKPLSKRR